MFQAMRKINYKFDVIILTTILVISIIESVHTDIIFYNAGLVNGHTSKAVSYSLLYELLKIVIVIFAVTRIFFHLKPEKRSKKYAITALMSFLIFIGYWISLPMFHQPGAVHFLRGFEKWVAKNVDVDAIQTWIMSQDAGKYLGHRYVQGNFPSDLPDFITNPNPFWIDIYESEIGRYVGLLWPHGFVEYNGVVIGSSIMKIKQEELIKHSNTDFEYRRSSKPRVYAVVGR